MVRASSHVLYLLSVVANTEPKQVYGDEQSFVSERTIKDIIIIKIHLSSGPPATLCSALLSQQLFM
jgi:hypothetical protein